MQLKLESEPFTFDSLFNSMSGPHGQNVGFNDAVEDKQGLETMQMRHILNQKRGQEEQDQADSKKRSKFDYGVQHSQSNDNNSFHVRHLLSLACCAFNR